MPNQTYLNTPGAIDWLIKTHCPNLRISWQPRTAMIFGNEDSPEEIWLYPRQNATISDNPLIGKPYGEHYLFCGPLQFQDAIEIDNAERERLKETACH